MREPQPKAIYLKDYVPPPFTIDAIDLEVDLREQDALVKARLNIRRRGPGPLALDGDELELVSVLLNEKKCVYSVTRERLTIDEREPAPGLRQSGDAPFAPVLDLSLVRVGR